MRAYRLAIALICGAAAFAVAPAAKAGGFFGGGCGTCGVSVGYAPGYAYGGYGYGAGYASPVYSLGYGTVADCGGGCGYGGYAPGYSYGAVGFGTGCGHCGTAVYATPVYVVNQGQYYPYVHSSDFYNRSYYSGGPYGNPLGHGYGYGRGYGYGGYGHGHGGYETLRPRVDYTYGTTGPRVISVPGYYGPRYRVRHEAAYRPAYRSAPRYTHEYRGPRRMPLTPAYK
jgi:hypothetical protein